MANVEHCPLCGQKVVQYKHNINKVLINALWKLQCAGGKGKLKELGLNNSEFANFQKLKYFELVEKRDIDDKSIYHITQKGTDFLAESGTCPEYVITKCKEIIDVGNEIYISSVKDYAQTKEQWQSQASFYNK